jgi:hypothetical protein
VAWNRSLTLHNPDTIDLCYKNVVAVFLPQTDVLQQA